MKEAAPMAGKLIPSTLTKRAASNSKGLQQTTQETEQSTTNLVKSPPKKKKSLSKSHMALEDLYKATAAASSREVNILFAKFADVISERAAAGNSHVRELDNFLKEARNLESYLLEKKKHLRQTLAQISDKLKG